jgi:3-methyladenine DNA glycosylase/8-oxoguanine DNA glycosylase
MASWHDAGVALDTRRARRHLMAADPVLAALIRRAGPCRLGASRHEDPFFLLLRAIVSQQLSTRAAATIFGRLCALFPAERPSASRLLALDDATLRGVGLSTNKTRFVRDLAARVRDRRLDLAALEHQDDADALRALTAVLGIGTWTAEIFLMFQLHRPDVFPAADLGLLTALQRVYGLRTRPTPQRARRLAERWRPHRSVAAWYLWRSLELGTGG